MFGVFFPAGFLLITYSKMVLVPFLKYGQALISVLKNWEKLEYLIAELWNHRGIIKRDIFLLHAFPVPQELNAQQPVVH